jgi:Ribbon-helix-helix protein, copG family
MTTRVNARIDEELAKKLDRLRRTTGKTTTEIVAVSIAAYYDAVTSSSDAALLLAGFIGSGDAPEGLSEHYKSALGESLRRKVRAR